MPARRFLSLALLLVLAAAQPSAKAQLLTVESVKSSAFLERDGVRTGVKGGDAVQEGNLLTVAADGALTLRLSRYGIVELGPSTQLRVERLPFASYADDLRTVFRLESGFLRLIWKYPDTMPGWPLFVYLGTFSAGIGAGETFFETGAQRRIVCSAEGIAQLASASRLAPLLLEAHHCANLATSGEPRPILLPNAAWAAVRRDRSLGALALEVPGADVTLPQIYPP